MGGAMQIARRLPFPSETSSSSSSSSSKRVFNEISSLMRGSNRQWRGRSFAASVPSDTPKVKKGRKRVSKDERKALVESFVNNYRAMNLGKFPTASDATREVGGSYYVIRKILQELVYESKTSSIKTRDQTSLSKEQAKDNESSTEIEDVSSSQMTVDAGNKDAQTVAVNDVDTGDFSCKNFGVKEEPQTSILVEKTLSEEVAKPTGTGDASEYVATQSHLPNGEAKELLHPCPEKPEYNMKEKTPSEDVLDFDGPNPKAEQYEQAHELEKFARDSSEKQTDEELEKKSSMWGNLKSLADGIVNLWKKL